MWKDVGFMNFDVAISNILYFFVHFLWEDLMRLGHLLGF
jgi:hypothetical protein